MLSEQMQIMVVDDEEALRDLLARKIKRLEHVVHTAASAEEALEQLPHLDIDVYVLDISLPGISGVELLRVIRSQGWAGEAVMLTGHAAVGTEAGTHLVATVRESGWSLLLAGVTITVVPMVAGAVVGYYLFGINFLSLLGVLTGSMTSTPGLAAATPMTHSNAPAVAYATVYPFALVLMIVACQLIGRL